MIYHLFLKIGLTWARHHSDGSLPVLMERSKITCIMGAISSCNSFNRIGLNLSGPAALPGLRFLRASVCQPQRYQSLPQQGRTPASLGAMPQRVYRRSQPYSEASSCIDEKVTVGLWW